MLTIKCPHCSTALKLSQAPASGKVKCPKCSNVLSIKAPAAASAAPAGASAGRSAAPQVARPQTKTSQAPARSRATSGATLDPDDAGFDFGQINYPSASPVAAVSHFPTAGQNMQVYDGPIPGDPLEVQAREEAKAQGLDPEQTADAAPAKKGSNTMLIVGAVVGVLAMVGVGVGAMVMMGGSGGSGAGEVDVLAALQSTAPQDYQAVGFQGCAVLVPKGELQDPNLRGVIECTIVRSDESGSYFFFGVMDGGKREVDAEQMTKKASRQLGGEIMGGGKDYSRGQYKGTKGKLDGSLFVPNMMVEVFHHEERFIIMGCAPASMGASVETQMGLDRNLEEAQQKVFWNSLKVGPKPGWW